MNTDTSRIVVDGPDRYREAKGYAAIRRQLWAEVAQRYSEEKERASPFKRLWIEVKIRREVAARMKEEFPPASLHILPAGGATTDSAISDREAFRISSSAHRVREKPNKAPEPTPTAVTPRAIE